MSITLDRLCENAENTYGMKLCAGAAGMDHFVRWVHMVEDPDMSSLLHGNELVLTTGIAEPDTEWLGRFAVNLRGNNAVGLVVSIGPYVDSMPKTVIDYCEKNGMPLFTVPQEMNLIDITYDFCHRIVASDEIEAGLATAFKGLIFEPNDEKAYLRILEECGFPKSASYCIAALNIHQEARDEADDHNFKLTAQRVLNKIGSSFCLFLHDKRLIVVLRDFTPKQLDRFLTELQNSYENANHESCVSAGISPSGEGYSFVTDGYHKAISALKVAEARDDSRVYYKNMDLYKLLTSVGSDQVLKEMYQESLGALEEFDKENGTDYMDSLRCYLEHNSSVQEVAQLTFVHRNTINYKIRRIREILDCEFTQENRLRLMLAFYIGDLL